MKNCKKRGGSRGRKLSLSQRNRWTQHAMRCLFVEAMEQRVLLTAVTSVSPPANSYVAPRATDITATFNQDINGATATLHTLAVHSTQRGQLVGVAATVSTAGHTIDIDPTSDFFPGELIQVTATSGIQSTAADPVEANVWQFRTAVAESSGLFSDSGQVLINSGRFSLQVSLGDVDADGDLDAFVTNEYGGSAVWLNDGNGIFTDSGQIIGNHVSHHISLADLDGDGDLDAFMANVEDSFRGGAPNRVWLNDGSGEFTDSGQSLGNKGSEYVELSDLDGDGDLDAVVANWRDGNRVWLNNGGAVFADSGQNLGQRASSVSLGDLDDDGDSDAFVTHWTGDHVWLNNGSGTFSENGQNLGGNNSHVKLGDSDGDGDLDAFTSGNGSDSHVWLNEGGLFTDSGQGLGEHEGMALGDLDGDGDLDAFEGNHVWLNDEGQFSDTALTFGEQGSSGVALGDLDGDGDLDRFEAGSVDYNRVWLNLNSAVTLSVDTDTIDEAAGVATVTATLSGISTNVVTVTLGFSGPATSGADYTFSSNQIVIPAGTPSGAVTITAVEDSVKEGHEAVFVDIIAVTNSTEAGESQVVTRIIDDDEPATIVSPPADSHTAPASTDVSATFDQSINPATATIESFVVHSTQHGQLIGTMATVSATGGKVTLDPASNFFPGEQVEVTATAGIEDTTGQPVDKRVWTFRTEVPFGSGRLSDSGQSLGREYSSDVSLGDLDGDGDLDAFVAGRGSGPAGANHVWLNDGFGSFTDSGQLLGNNISHGVSLGDVDGDGDLDAFVANDVSANRVWVNNGSGIMTSGQAVGNLYGYGRDVVLGDLDGDGDLDAFVANKVYEGNRVWLNDGGRFSDTGQTLGDKWSFDVSLGDVDGDGDLDAVVASRSGNRVWLNGGGGLFTDSGQSLGDEFRSWKSGVSLGDLDGDGDLDAFFVDRDRDRVWLNSGGEFVDSGQSLGDGRSFDVSLGDLDGDGDLDALVTVGTYGFADGNRVLLNDGRGVFTDSAQRLGPNISLSISAALGDLDGDGDLDAFVVNEGVDHVWLSDSLRSLAIEARDVSNPEGDAGVTPFTFALTRSGDASAASSVEYVVTGTGANPANAADFGGSFPNGVVNFAANELSQTITLDVSGDTVPEADESFTVTLSNPVPATQIFPDFVNVTIENDDLPESASLVATQDNTLIETLDGSLSNGSGQWFFAGLTGGRSGPPLRRGLIGFDMADAGIPAGATVVSATLRLNMSRTSSGPQDVSLHRLTSDWGQGTSDASGGGGSGGPSTNNDATWIHTFFNASTWTTPGGDFQDVASATTSVDTVGLYQWSGAGMVADVQEWLDSGGGFGWLVRGNEAGNISTAKRFDSREHSSAENRPVLEIEYALPIAGSSLSITAVDGTKPEGNSGNTPFTFMVTRSGDTASATSIDYLVSGSGDSPANATDFGGPFPSGVVNFAATETSQTITIDVTGDTLVEADESFTVTLSSPTPEGTQITTATASGTIQNDDHPLPSVTLQVDSATISETGGVATFTVTLSESTTVPVTVDLGISGTAAANDYAASAAQIVVAAGATTDSVTVTAVDDALDEVDETVIVDITVVTNGTESGVQQQTITIIDDDEPLGFVVSSLTPTSSGFVAAFNADLDPGPLNLYDTQSAGLGAADVVLQGTTSGPIAGSVIVSSALRMVTFIKTGDLLAPDVYSVTLRSADDGFKDTGGVLLDGNGDGTAGGDFSDTFTIAVPAANTVTVSIPDLIRGPGQVVNLPADTSAGIPLSISEGAGVRNAEIQIDYDPALLTITAATVGPTMSEGATVVLDTSIAGTAIVTFTSPTDLPTGSNVLVNIQATIPATDPSGIYGKQQVLDIHSVTISDGNDNAFPVITDDAFHLASYFADVSGNGRINASDAAQVARFAALIDSGFSASLTTDPIVVGDISGNGRINAADASRVAQFAALIDVPEIPPIPAGAALAGVVHLGPGLPELGFAARQVASATSEDTGIQSSDGALLPLVGPDPYQAVDKVMASMVMLDADQRLILDLEDAMADLLSTELLAD